MIFTSQAAGKLFLMGEHAVLKGYPAILMSLEQHIQVSIEPRTDDLIEIHSKFGQFQTHLNDIKVQAPLQFVLAVLALHQEHLPSGCNIHITADFSDQVGFGSSAAVTAALLKALYAWLNRPATFSTLFEAGKKAILLAQGGLGSGADLAAALAGGVIVFDPKTQTIRELPTHPPIEIIYTGYKTPTPVVIQQVQARFQDTPEVLAQIYETLGQLTVQAEIALIQSDWIQLGALFQKAQAQLERLGVSDDHIRNLIQNLQADPDVSGAKISGAGLGDCVIAVRKTKN